MSKSRISASLLFTLSTLLLLFFFFFPGKINPAEAYSDQVYNSLLRTRDALIDQKKSIEQALESTRQKIDALNAHLKTLEDYLNQTEADLKDVERALRNR